MSRRPTDKEYAAYDGMHCSAIWKRLSEAWRCPVCDRTKREILVWGVRNGSNARVYGKIGFKTAIHKHHDHGADPSYLGHKVEARFPDTYLCGSCNLLDARLKKKIDAVEAFSYSPQELRQCLRTARPNEGFKAEDIDFDRAMEIYVAEMLLPND